MEVRFETNESGDWERLYINRELYYEGHSVPTSVWLNAIRKLGATAQEVEVPDEDFE